jgi:hypothetical protein
MERDLERHQLEQADTHIAEARKKLERQRALVAKLGKSDAPEVAVLHVMEDNIRALEGHRAFILGKLGLYQLGEDGKQSRPA